MKLHREKVIIMCDEFLGCVGIELFHNSLKAIVTLRFDAGAKIINLENVVGSSLNTLVNVVKVPRDSDWSMYCFSYFY